MTRDWHGVGAGYVRSDGAVGDTLRALDGSRGRALDAEGVRAAWGEAGDHERCIVRGVRRGARADVAWAPLGFEDWARLFEQCVAECARPDAVLALGGGVDAAAVLAAWRGATLPRVVTLRTGIAGYDEVDGACAIASALGATCDAIDTSPEELVTLAREAAVAAGTPFYDLHPVHRSVIAAAARGAVLVTGDGADAVFAHRADLDYVPHVVSIARARGVETTSPFFDTRLIAATPHDPDKTFLRRYLAMRGLGTLAAGPKRPRAIGAIAVPAIDGERLRVLAERVDVRPDPASHRVGWWTLDALVAHLEAA